MKIPFNLPYLTGKEETYLLDALRSQQHCGNHDYCQRVIRQMEIDHGYKEVFLTPSCTSALEMGAVLLGIGPGDEVILPSYTFSSTANAVVLFGAVPVFCEVDPHTLNMDVEHLARLVTDKTRLILPIDYAGISCEIDAIRNVADKYDIPIMQDCAQSYGSYYKGSACGTQADLACFSFHETKNFNAGEGGALVVNDESLIDRAFILQEKGTNRRDVLQGLAKKYSWVDVGSSYLLSDLLAAVLLAQLEEEQLIVSQRKAVCEHYDSIFQRYVDSGHLRTIAFDSNVYKSNYHAFWVQFDTSVNRELFLGILSEAGVSAYIGYVPLHSSPMGRRLGNSVEDLPITEDVAARTVRLPLYTELAEDGVDKCAETISRALEKLYG